jgi:hypothetical protein
VYNPSYRVARACSALQPVSTKPCALLPYRPFLVVAECPALPGCVSQGRTQEEAMSNIKEAITAWFWAEDQKAVASLSLDAQREPVVVAI